MPRTTTVEPTGCPARLRAICCDSLGYVKVVQSRVEQGGDKGALEVVARWGQPGSDLGIVAMSYFPGSSRLAVARRSGKIEVLDTSDGTVCADYNVPKASEGREGNDLLIGLHLFQESSVWGNAVLSCKESGDLAIQKLDALETPTAQWSVAKSGAVLAMKVHHGQRFAAFGGKGLELSVWDLDKRSKSFQAKQPEPNFLNIILPAWVTTATFLTPESHHKIAVGTGDHQVRVYDIRAQKRHVLAFEYGESPIKALAEDPDGFTLYVGTGSGDMGCFDTRNARLLGGFKGKMAGSVRSITRHPTLPLLASCGLDRFLRVHDVRTRQLVGKIFLKQPLVDVAFEDIVDTASSGNGRSRASIDEKIKEERDKRAKVST